MRIVCIGAGRLAHHLMPALDNNGCDIIQVFNRTAASAVLLAEKLKKATPVSHAENIDRTADLYFLMVADDAVPAIARHLQTKAHPQGTVVHTSGTVGLDALPFEHRGIFYPLQTFSENHITDWANTPIIITTENDAISDTLHIVASRLSSNVYRMNEDEKAVLHIAAVFANNFSNHMLTLAEKICEEKQLPFEVLKPLIRSTYEKALRIGPVQGQTGPAVRRDQRTIEHHLHLLEGHPELIEIYKLLSKSIRKYSTGAN